MVWINDVDSTESVRNVLCIYIHFTCRFISICSTLVITDVVDVAHAIFLIDVCLMLFTQKTIYEIKENMDNPSKFLTNISNAR